MTMWALALLGLALSRVSRCTSCRAGGWGPATAAAGRVPERPHRGSSPRRFRPSGVVDVRLHLRLPVLRWKLGRSGFVRTSEPNPRVTFFEIPMIGGLARMGKWFIDSGMRRGTPKADHENVITVYGGTDRVEAAGGIQRSQGRISDIDRPERQSCLAHAGKSRRGAVTRRSHRRCRDFCLDLSVML